MRLKNALAGITKIGIDTAPLIYLVERDPNRPPLMRAVVRRMDQGTLTASCSIVTLTEVLTVPTRNGDAALQRRYRRTMLHSRNLLLFPVELQIAERAAELRAVYGLRTPDALVTATAIISGCQALLTNDRKLARVVELQVLVLDDLTL